MSELLVTLAAFQSAMEVLIYAITIIILLSSLDDLFVDVYYWFRELYRWYWIRARYPALKASALDAKPERPIAILVPAWKEHDVIQAMLRTNFKSLQYADYIFFVGVYQNDPETIAEVETARAEVPNVVMATVPRDGPTSKADCLNVAMSKIAEFERQTGKEFVGIALHDSEDVIHPYELRLFNYLLDRMDLIQLPVYSFQRGLNELVAGTYMDEFAEWHSKDLVVRESMTGVVPCAGVSACFSRRAIEALRQDHRGEVFSTESLTEDYDIALRISNYGMREIFVRFPIEFTIEALTEAAHHVLVEKRLPIATREFFPSDFRAAYRQRARWLIGIVFQGWSQHGWIGGMGAKYFFLRDRKGLVTAPMALLAYFAVSGLIVIELLFQLFPVHQQLQYVLLDTPTYRTLLAINLAFLMNRLLQRSFFTSRIYGIAHGLMAGPRMVVSNILNFFATMRASYIFARHKLTGRPIVWDKTFHIYPI
jgi:bacteriophage N4 adsorption protein B